MHYKTKIQNSVNIKEKFSKLITLAVEKNLNSEIKKFLLKGIKINKESIIIIVLIFGEIGLISSNKPVKKKIKSKSKCDENLLNSNLFS